MSGYSGSGCLVCLNQYLLQENTALFNAIVYEGKFTLVPANPCVQVKPTAVVRVDELQKVSKQEEASFQVSYMNGRERSAGDVYEAYDAEDS